jgi:hypothetical protein
MVTFNDLYIALKGSLELSEKQVVVSATKSKDSAELEKKITAHNEYVRDLIEKVDEQRQPGLF